MAKRKRKRAEESRNRNSSTERPKKTKTEDLHKPQKLARGGAKLAGNSERVRSSKPKSANKPKVNGQPQTSNGLDKALASSMSNKDLDKALASSWSTSLPIGGRLLDVDPIFSEDEQYFILAYPSQIKIYASNTSLLVRTLVVKKDKTVAACSLSASDPSHLYVALGAGHIELWNWLEGSKLDTWNVRSQLFNICVVGVEDEEDSHDILFAAESAEDRKVISAYSLRPQSPMRSPDVHVLLDTKEPVSHLQVVRNGHIVIAAIGKQLVIGTRKKITPIDSVRSLDYTWREMQCSDSITTLSYHISDADQDAESTSRTRLLDVVVGTSRGPMFLYRDILTHLISIEQHKEDIAPHVSYLHWHRDAVRSVKFSLDGDYLISGGLETVLVIWQLDTGLKQFLPHLSSTIEAIVVSPSGTSYGIRLADNSAMVLSTMELQPTFSISGLQLPAYVQSPVDHEHRLLATGETKLNSYVQRPAAICTTPVTSQMLFAVPASVSSRSDGKESISAPYLQVVDPKTGTALSKQALARTKITDRNMGPEGNLIEEPNVVFIRLSSDGKWMATVDEWMPPIKDIQRLHVSDDVAIHGQRKVLESYLKFWSWSELAKSWELVWRVDGPHKPESGTRKGYGAVLDLIEDPSKVGFYTIGDDGMVKAWVPHTRSRNGIQVRDQHRNLLASWTGRQLGSIPVSSNGYSSAQASNSTLGKLSVSLDGSLLSAAVDNGSGTIVRIINIQSSGPPQPCLGPIPGRLSGIGLVDKYLVLLADDLVVWDLVDDVMNYSIQLNQEPQIDSPAHLAVDQEHGTFAVSIASKISGIPILAVFDPSKPAPTFVAKMTNTPISLIAAPSQKGYYAIDGRSEIRLVLPSASVQCPSAESKSLELPPATFAGLENVFGNGTKSGAEGARPDPSAPRSEAIAGNLQGLICGEDADYDAINQNELAEIFSANQALSLPPISTMFAKVAALVSRKVARVT